MFTAIWNRTELARGDDVIEVEGRLYFQAGDVRHEFLSPAADRSVCEWKGGEAEYFDVVVDGAVNRAAAWRYPRLGDHARPLTGRIAFWKDVAIDWAGAGPAPAPARIEAQTPNVAKALGANDVVWRPALAAALGNPAAMAGFAGYLIPSLRVLVDVLATPPAADRPARIAEAGARAEVIAAWNAAHPGEPYGYIAVWGSATPDAADVAAVRRHEVRLALG